jgi:hypothetical protein
MFCVLKKYFYNIENIRFELHTDIVSTETKSKFTRQRF